MTKTQILKAARGIAFAAFVAVSACADDETGGTFSPRSESDARLSVKLSDLNASTGERITLALEAESIFDLGGVQGRLRFDPERLSFAGQLPESGTMVVINDSEVERGEIRLAAAAPSGLVQRVALFAFDVRAPGYIGGIDFEPEAVATLSWEPISATVELDIGLDASLPAAAEPVRWTYQDWARFFDPSLEASDFKIARIPGLPDAGTRYGDANLNGILNILDFADVLNTTVGNREVLIGTDGPAVDRVTAANVRPLAAGGCRVGHSGPPNCATRVIDVFDAGAIGQEVTGVNAPVVGDVIPLPKGSYAAGETVFLAAQTITGTRTFDRDTLYVLQGVLRVGNEAGAAGQLIVQPGTRVEGELESAIFVTRNGRLIADGTPTEPITFTCRGPKSPACWGGVFIAGNAVVNEQDPAVGPAPAIPGRNPAGGQNQRQGEGGAVNFGGGNDADSSGVIRYARFMYGGREITPNNELNNLTIGACGSRTVLAHIQVHGGSDDGLEFFGGRCNIKYLYATANDDDQFDYSFGYDGDVQFLLIQNLRVATNAGDKAFEVDNTETVATYNNTPRTSPQIFNMTSAGGNLGSGSTHIHYRRGAGGTLRNMLLIRGATAFLIDDNQTCPATSGLSINNVAVLGVTTLIQNNPGCAPSPLGGAVVTGAYSGQVKDPFNTIVPDFRPVGGGIAGATATPPNNGFFVTSATYFGAVQPVGVSLGRLPWYAGWTEPWQGPATP